MRDVLPLSLSLTTGMEMASLTPWVSLQKPVDLFHTSKKLLFTPDCLNIPPRNIPSVRLGGWNSNRGVAVLEPRLDLEILGRFLMFCSTVNVTLGLFQVV